MLMSESTARACGIYDFSWTQPGILFQYLEQPSREVYEKNAEALEKYGPDMSREAAQAVAVEISLDLTRKLSDIADAYYFFSAFIYSSEGYYALAIIVV